MLDVNQLFRQAEVAFSEGRTTTAQQALSQVERLAGPHPAVLHLRALVEQQAGNAEKALTAFRSARKLAPGDPQIANNHGNLLDALGRSVEALEAHDAAVRLVPRDADTRVNRAITLQHLGEIDRARSDFLAAIELASGSVRALIGLAGLERQVGDLDRAGELYDRALALSPGQPIAAHGRAIVAAARGEADAIARYRTLASAYPGDIEVQMGLIETLDAAGDPAGRAMLAERLKAQPEWIEGHRALARMRADVAEDYVQSFREAIAARPGDRALREAHWRTLVYAERHGEALDAITRTRTELGPDRTLTLEEAAIASEAGDGDRAATLLDTLPDSMDVQLVRGRLALRQRDAALAAANLAKVVAQAPGAINAWAHLGLAWRLLDDPRVEWLYGSPELWRAIDLGLSEAELSDLADTLREIHRARVAPLGQSLRGGTQTRGRLLLRADPAIRLLRDRLADAVAGYWESLPAIDLTHPLLRHRGQALRFDGSWSVRLRDGGHHVAHIHPEGVLSSACYVALPDAPGDDRQAGWLELGRPPVELGLSLEPLAVIEPEPGRLALFPSYLHHGTRKFAAGERLTVAFDLAPI